MFESESARRYQRVEFERKRVAKNMSLSDRQRERIIRMTYATVMTPLLKQFDDLLLATFRRTIHEERFWSVSGEAIMRALQSFKDPQEFGSFVDLWRPFQDIQRRLQKTLQQRSLQLTNVGSSLGTLAPGVLEIPGVSTAIVGIAEQIEVLPTKTRPKKFSFIGSNGEHYPFLVKGHEDLHLDERMMQFLAVVDDLLQRDKNGWVKHLSTRGYPVIPLGNSFGLIAWVEGTTAIFTLYRKWQQRQYNNSLLMSKEGDGPISLPQKPQDAFAERLARALDQNDLPRTTLRNQIPQSLLEDVHRSLESEAPDSLISNEIICTCADAQELWKKQKCFSRSTAVMSIVGYVIGLGDRHLDNLLVDFSAGEMVHIDFNVCFEKGKQLRVPETVPFRLTKNILGALGFLGVEGLFRRAAEDTLKVLRSSREVLLTLLEAFIHDPLVDWAFDIEVEQDRRLAELEVQIGLLRSRLAEVRNPFKETLLDLSTYLPDLAAYALAHVERVGRMRALVDELSHLETTSPVEDIEIRTCTMELTMLGQNLTIALKSTAAKSSQHENALRLLTGPFLQALANELFNIDSALGSVRVQLTDNLSHVKKLQRSAKALDVDISTWLVQRKDITKSTFEHLLLYQAVSAPIVEFLVVQDPYSKLYRTLKQLAGNQLLAGEEASTGENSSTFDVSRVLWMIGSMEQDFQDVAARLMNFKSSVDDSTGEDNAVRDMQANVRKCSTLLVEADSALALAQTAISSALSNALLKDQSTMWSGDCLGELFSKSNQDLQYWLKVSGTVYHTCDVFNGICQTVLGWSVLTTLEVSLLGEIKMLLVNLLKFQFDVVCVGLPTMIRSTRAMLKPQQSQADLSQSELHKEIQLIASEAIESFEQSVIKISHMIQNLTTQTFGLDFSNIKQSIENVFASIQKGTVYFLQSHEHTETDFAGITLTDFMDVEKAFENDPAFIESREQIAVVFSSFVSQIIRPSFNVFAHEVIQRLGNSDLSVGFTNAESSESLTSNQMTHGPVQEFLRHLFAGAQMKWKLEERSIQSSMAPKLTTETKDFGLTAEATL
ncbi:kinase-like protein [Gonapodya prolifera JEL478]|uniref:Kinase-like protein n=1 Tax=Gonapodya prolifera (strain JEL478) TaxID=1344416 RepID=A0A139AMY1_GONPJ|nr:kinase-like protein [Gonapodya prolifera JEL478]|eukprot:KXS17964.1 kinase-like protein [Gonapodya prolifera JEL478]